MAAPAAALENNTRCSICLEIYRSPKILSCHHSFCLICVQRLPIEKHMITCPECRKETELPNDDARNLQNSFIVNGYLEIREEMERSGQQQANGGDGDDDLRRRLTCSECNNQYKNPRTLNCGHTFCMGCIDKLYHVEDHTVMCPRCPCKTKLPRDKARNLPVNPSIEELFQLQRKIDQPKTEMCPRHKEEGLKAYCTSCRQVTCWRCAFEMHPGHKNVIPVDEYYPLDEKEINTELTKVEKRINELNGTIEAISKRQNKVQCTKESVSQEIQRKAREVIERVQSEERRLLEEVDRIAKYKMGLLEKLKEDAQGKVDRLHISKLIVNLTISKTSKQAVIRNKQKLLEHTKLAEKRKFDPEMFQPKTTGNFSFQTRDVDVAFGYVTLQPVKSIEDVRMPYDVSVSRNSNELIVAQRTDTNRITLIEQTGRRRSMVGNKRADLNLRSVCGLAVTQDTQHVWVCTDKVQKFQIKQEKLIPVAGYDKIKAPQGIAISKKTGSVVVVGGSGKKILVLPENVKHVLNVMIETPKGLAFDREGKVCILDRSSVKKFNEKGEFMGQFELKHGDADEDLIEGVSSITTDENGLVYVTEEASHCVSVFNEEGRFLCCLGGYGGEEGQFNCPNGIMADGNGQLYVCDTSNNRIVVFDIL